MALSETQTSLETVVTVNNEKSTNTIGSVHDGTVSGTGPLRPATTSKYSQRPFPGLRWWIFAILAFMTAGYAGCFLFGYTPGDPTVKAKLLGAPPGIIHVSGGLIAMVLGPFQFLTRLRHGRPAAHRWIGRIYAVAVALSSPASLYVTWTSLAYPWGNVGFAMLGSAWLYTLTLAMKFIWTGDVVRHKEWMTRNFALTYAAVSLRIQLPTMIILGMPTPLALSITGYTCWIPNLLIAEQIIKRGH